MTLLEQEPLSRHTTLRAGGPARYYCEAASIDDLRQALAFAHERRLPIFVLGGGSNVLAGDEGFAGLVVHVALKGIEFLPDRGSGAILVAAAGEDWDAVVLSAVERGLRGIENLSLIPGSVGGGVAGNIGAYGAEMKDALAWAEVMDEKTGAMRRLNLADCAFRYRFSHFKTPEGRRQIITRAAFDLRTDRPLDISYRDLQVHFQQAGVISPTLAQVREAVIAVRRGKLPETSEIGTAGSFFKNPVIPQAHYENLRRRYPDLPGYPEADGRVKVPLGWVLDKVCGFKGARRGKVGTHPKQALVIVNDGGSAAEVTALVEEIATAVRAKTGIEIAWEVERLENPRRVP